MDGSHVDCVSVCTPTTACSSQGDTWTFKPDAVAPSTISLTTSAGCYDNVVLSWYAPGDDGTSGTAAAYDLRWSTSSITSGTFAEATQIATSAPHSAGYQEQLTVSVPRCSGTRYYAIKTRDEAYNWSSLSNSPAVSPACPTPPLMCDRASQSTSREPSDLPASAELFAPSPNPVDGDETTVRYAVPGRLEGEEYDLALFDLAGRRVGTLGRGKAMAGNHSAAVALRSRVDKSVGRGVYFIRLRIGLTTMTQRVVIVH